jgi:hypothetical protein
MGYPAYVPVLLGLGLAVELVWLGSVIARPGERRRAVAPWLFALLPLLGFTLQELLERWLSGAGFPWWMVLQPTFRVGLALQIPFAIAAYLIARLAQRGAERAGRALRPRATRVVTVLADVVALFTEVLLPRRGALAGGYAGRGPPAVALAAHP